MLATASLAAGFVVADVTASRANGHCALGDLDADRTVGTAQDLVLADGLAGIPVVEDLDEEPPGRLPPRGTGAVACAPSTGPGFRGRVKRASLRGPTQEGET